MRAVLTGATGHLGSNLAAMLVEQGHSVLAIVRPGSDMWRIRPLVPRISILTSELKELSSVQLESFAPEVMFHLAWGGITSDARNSGSLVLPNIENSLKAFEAAAGAGCKTWVGVGSQAEYGPHDGAPAEDSRCRPTSLYGAAKVAVCQLVRTLCGLSQIRFVWFRLFATYGPMDDQRHLIPLVIEQFLRDQTPSLTPGEQTWDYLHVRDAAAALSMAGTLDHIRGIFNLGSGESIAVADLVRRIHGGIGPRCETGLGSVPYPPGQIMQLKAEMATWRGLTGWRPEIPLAAGIEETIGWHKARRKSLS